ncbi:MAG: Clp protease N-terminal domain-containing protein, partial [Dolichospermum sp.]
MFERFTEKAIKVIMLAQEEARRLGHNFVGTEQILLGLIGEGTGVAAKVLIFIVLVAGFDLLLGYTGIVSFAHTMFFGIGAYGIAISANTWGPTWGAIGAG